MNDVQASVAFTRSPCFYSTEATFALPAARDIWAAPDALAWRAAYLAKAPAAERFQPTLLDIMQDPSTIQSLSPEYDCELSALAALLGLWPQLVALQDARTFYRAHRPGNTLPQNRLWQESQRQDLYARLGEIRDTAHAMAVLTDEARMVCELFMASLFVSFADMEKLVGRFGIEESRSTIPNLQAWASGDESRYARWHAGQVLRAAQAVTATQLRGFYAMAVYQACLVLALPFLLDAVRLASSAGESAGASSAGPHQTTDIVRHRQTDDLIVLNGAESMQTKSFLLTGQGRPALLLGQEVLALSGIETIATAIAGIFESNHRVSVDHLPPMEEKLVALVKELTKFTGC